MNNVKVNRGDLLEILKKNREQHKSVVLTALAGYRADAIAELERSLDNAKRGKRVVLGLSLIEPMDQTREYDRAIRMMEMSVDEQVELTERDFARYVMDEWEWSAQFSATNTRYLK